MAHRYLPSLHTDKPAGTKEHCRWVTKQVLTRLPLSDNTRMSHCVYLVSYTLEP